jgi:cardiolipin synthase
LRALRHVPNILSTIRILLVLPIALTLVHAEFAVTLWLFAAAAASDGADGFLAKRFGWQSPLGAILDPIADKLLLATVFVTLGFLGLVPFWLMIAAVARDVIIVCGALVYRYWFGPLTVRPSAISKLNTLCQVVFILSVIGRQQFAVPPEWAITLLGALVFLTVVISGINYLLVYGQEAFGEARSRYKRLRASN